MNVFICRTGHGARIAWQQQKSNSQHRIFSFFSPDTPGSGYELLHHVMGELDGIRGAWGYPEGGMGAVSGAIAKSALAAGTEIFTEKEVGSVP